MIVERITEYLEGVDRVVSETLLEHVRESCAYAFSRQFMEREAGDGRLRLSSSGHCLRKLAYALHRFEKKGKEIDARAMVNFFYGDVIELMVVNLALLAGCDLRNVGMEQMTVKTVIAGTKIEGHPDGLYIENGETYLLEIKSMNDFQFRDFEKGTIESSYLAQVNMYMETLNLTSALFIAVNKQNGVMKEQIVAYSAVLGEQLRHDLESVLISTPDNLPERLCAAGLSGKLPWQATYCPYWGHCFPEAERVVEKGRYALRIKTGDMP